MPKVEEFRLRPLGWENDPEQEQFKLSTLDYLSTITYTNTALFFRLRENEKAQVIHHYHNTSKYTNLVKQ